MEQSGLTRTLFANTPAVDERQVRRLLACARRADPLRGDPLAEELLHATHSSNIGEALRKLVDLTFRDLGYMGSRLCELIHRSDLDAALPFTAVASEMGLSLRQFFRYRARAVAMLAAQLRTMVRHPVEPSDTLGSLFDTLVDWNPEGALDVYSGASQTASEFESLRALKAFVETAREIPAAVFERAQKQSAAVAFAVRAKQRCLCGDMAGAQEDVCKAEAAMRAVTESDLRIALQREIGRVRFLFARNTGGARRLLQAVDVAGETAAELELEDSINALEAQCAAGEFTNIDAEIKHVMAVAQRRHEVSASARLCVLSAFVAANRGDLRRARQLTGAAGIAAEHHLWLSAETSILERRVALLCGMCANTPDAFGALPEGSWHRTFLNSVVARELLAQRRLMEGASLASQCVATATERGYDGLAAYNECTLAAVDGLEGRRHEERERYLRSWCWYQQWNDVLLGLDLFTPPHAAWRDFGVFDCRDLGAEPLERQLAVALPITKRSAWFVDAPAAANGSDVTV